MKGVGDIGNVLVSGYFIWGFWGEVRKFILSYYDGVVLYNSDI